MNKFLITAILLCGFIFSGTAVSESETRSLNWQAEWIWTKENVGEPNTWVAFRKEIELDNIEDNVLAHVSADTKYWLWINGEQVVFEGSYTGGPSPVKPSPRTDNYAIASNKYYDSIDIASYLKPGKNTIAALVWFYGDNGKKGTHISSGKGGFIFQANVGTQYILSDASWKAKKHEAYQPITKKKPYRVAAWNINYDARKAMGDWSEHAWYMPNFDDKNWLVAKSGHRPPRAPFYQLFPSEIPTLTDHGLARCTNYPAEKFPFVSDGKKIKCQLDFNKNITPYFDIESEAGQAVHIDTNMRLNTIETFYTTKAGRQQFESYSWSNGRIIEFTFTKGTIIHDLKYRWTGVGETPGYFTSSDDWLTRIWQMSENTLYICARDNFMDTPDRERGLWIGDVADQASYLFYSMDQPGRDLLKKAIKVTLAFGDSETGIFAGLGPGRFRELPAQSLQFIDQGIWHYYYNTGDLETIEFAYPYVHQYLQLWGMKDNGLATFRGGAWRWTDWGPQDTIDYDVIQNALYYSALVANRKMAKATGNERDIGFYNERISSIEKAFQRLYWQNGYFSSKPGELKDDRANAVAILFGLAKPEQYQAIVENVLVPNHFASPHFEWMVYNAMAIAGHHDKAIARMKTRYSKQVDNPALSTLAEYLPSGGTENHAWNAPATVLSKYIVGVEPTSVGWKSYQIKPNLSHLTEVTQLVPSVKGDIKIAISVDKALNKVIFEVDSPDGTTAVVGIPKQYFDIRHLEVNHNMFMRNKKIKKNTKGIRFLGEDDKYLNVEISAGVWRFVATN